MINSHQTSLATAAAVPPGHSRSHLVLIPDPPPPSQGHSKFLIRFLVVVVFLHLFLSVGGFFYLNNNMNGKMPQGKRLLAKGKAANLSTEEQGAEEQETPYRVLARMVVELPHTPVKEFTPGYLQWDINHSFRRDINHYYNLGLTILEPGDYYVYSRVTFSRGDPTRALASKVKLRKTAAEREKTVMQAYCSLESHSESGSIPRLCTASQGEVVTLERGNQLGVWVQDLSGVSYEEGATTFGMYKL